MAAWPPVPPAQAAERLTLANAVSRAAAQAASARISDLASRRAEESAREERAGLFPAIRATGSQRNWTFNLASLGFSGAAFGTGNLIGPADAFDARFRAEQPIVDVSLWSKVGAARAEADAGKADA